MKREYNVGDIVQMNSIWGYKCGIIITIDDISCPSLAAYRVLIQGNNSPTWLSATYIMRRIYAKI
jgi:hypothetical protein